VPPHHIAHPLPTPQAATSTCREYLLQVTSPYGCGSYKLLIHGSPTFGDRRRYIVSNNSTCRRLCVVAGDIRSADFRYLFHHYKPNLRDATTVISETIVDICRMCAGL